MASMEEKLLRKIREEIGSALDEMDEDELREAIREHLDISDFIEELVEQDEDVKEAAKAKVKELLISEIGNCDDSEEFDQLINEVTWEDLVNGAFDIKDMIKDVIQNDPDISKELRKKVKEIIKSDIDDLDSSDSLPSQEEMLKSYNLEAIIADVLSDDETRDIVNKNIRDAIKEKIENEFSVDDIPDSVWDGSFTERIRYIMNEPDFQREFTESVDVSLKRAIISMVKGTSISGTLKNDPTFESIVKNNPDVKNIVQGQIDNLLRDGVFQESIKKLLVTQATKLMESKDLSKILLDQMMNIVVDRIVGNVFKL